jgi:acyl-[acyl carrier protein]--UDP-N-acetylglucosamine O-acyltransferase
MATRIHPSAVVESGAQLGTDVEIGPFVYVGGEVVLPARPGTWLVSAVHMVPAAVAEADWESLWASLAVELP